MSISTIDENFDQVTEEEVTNLVTKEEVTNLVTKAKDDSMARIESIIGTELKRISIIFDQKQKNRCQR